ncbi:MAG TPA: CHASE4 domain-containing protein, partial [Caulobacter sp.]|nr:CHASE4 domain-containing protein [Caulobacter sp.]
MDRRNIELKIFGLIAGMAAGMILLAGVALTVATRHADVREREYEQTLVGNGLRQRAKEIQTALNPYVIWDEAIIKLDNQFDLDWTRQNIGVSIGDGLGYKVVFVLDGEGRPIYGHIDGKDVSPDHYARYAAQTAGLMSWVRKVESNPKQVAELRAVHRSRVELIDGEPVLITVSLIRADLNAKLKGSRAPLLVSGIPVANSVVKAFSDRFLLHDTHIKVVRPDALATTEAQSVLGRAP